MCPFTLRLCLVLDPLDTSNKNIFFKMLRDVGMAVPKTTETRYGGWSVQARQDIQGLHKLPHPYILIVLCIPRLWYEMTGIARKGCT